MVYNYAERINSEKPSKKIEFCEKSILPQKT